MRIIIIICCIWLLGNMCIYSKRKIEEVVCLGFCILILLLQCLAMIRHLSWIGMIIFVISIFLLAICIYKKRWKDFLEGLREYIFTFGGAVFFVVSILCICFQYGRRVLAFDEFNFWATAIKTLWNYDGFAFGIEVWSKWEYPQGMPLLEWFGSYLTGHYAEWMFYTIRLIFDYSFIIPIFKNFKIKFYWSPLAAICVYLLPGIVNTTSFDVLSVDGDLALLFGYFIYSILDRKKKDGFYYFRNIILASTIVLIKDFSIVFVLYGCILLFALDYIEKDWYKLKTQSFCNGMIILLPFGILAVWSWYLKAIGYTSTQVSGRASYFLKSFLNGTWQKTGYENDFIITFFSCFFTGKTNYCLQTDQNSGFLTPFVIVLIVIGFIVILEKKRYIDKVLRNVLILFWGFVVLTYSLLFIIAHCTLFVGEIMKYVEYKFMNVSLGRYCAPVYLGGVLVCILFFFDFLGYVSIGNITRLKGMGIAGMATIILFCTNYSAVKISIWPLYGYAVEKRLENDDIKHSEEFEWTNKLEGNKKVYYLSSNYDVASAYRLVPIVLQLPDMTYQISNIGDLQNYLYDNEFEYLFYSDDQYEQLNDYFQEMLPEGKSLEIAGLYKIDMSNVKFQLEKVN